MKPPRESDGAPMTPKKKLNGSSRTRHAQTEVASPSHTHSHTAGGAKHRTQELAAEHMKRAWHAELRGRCMRVVKV